jgi:hypothetical protein
MAADKGRFYSIILVLLVPLAFGSWWLRSNHQEAIRKSAFLASLAPKHVYRLVLEIGPAGEDEKDDYWTVDVEEMYEVKPGCFTFLSKAMRPKNMFDEEILSMEPIAELEFDPNDQKLLVETAIRRLGNLVISKVMDDPKKAGLREIYRNALVAREVVLCDFNRESIFDSIYGNIHPLLGGSSQPDQAVFDQALAISHR